MTPSIAPGLAGTDAKLEELLTALNERRFTSAPDFSHMLAHKSAIPFSSQQKPPVLHKCNY
jgi:hypothetical protein